VKHALEPVVHDAASVADLLRDAVGALLDPPGRFGVFRVPSILRFITASMSARTYA
jgi:hypothetical protein